MKFFLWITFLGFIIHGSFAASFNDYLDSLFASHWPDSGFVATWESRQGSPLPVLPEGTRCRLVSPEPARWQGPMILTFQTETSDGLRSQFSIRGILRVIGPGLVPCRKIRSGEMLSPEKVQVATVDWTHLLGTPLFRLSDLEGKAAARTLVSTRPILREHVRERPVVLTGQEIYVEAVAGNVRARLRARTLEEGACGETIRVLLPSSSRPLKVRIQSAQTAQLIE
ncbi:MAG: flagellar basal body P-ring formation chaperone FlgA [bacterium]